MTKSSPSATARVRSAAASEPESGSVSAKAKESSPLTTPGTMRCFCSSVPCFSMA